MKKYKYRLFELVISFVILLIPISASCYLNGNTYYAYQTYLNQIKYFEYFLPPALGNNLVVAVIDDGVWLQHPDLVGTSWINSDESPNNEKDDDNNGYIDDYYGWNFLDNNQDLTTKGSHGTAVAGIIAAQNNDIGIVGIVPKAKIMPLIVCSDIGCPRSATINAIMYAANNGAHIINLSLGGSGYVGYTSDYDNAIEYAHKKGIIIVASAGNGDVESNQSIGQNLNFLKASPVSNDVNGINTVLGVGALVKNQNNYKTNWTNYGTGVEIYAPGEEIFSLSVPAHNIWGNYFDYWDGTSFSAPIVAGAAALLKSSNPNLKNWEVIDRLTKFNYLDLAEIFTGQIERCKIKGTDKSQYSIGETIKFMGEHLRSDADFVLSSSKTGMKINSKINFLDAKQFEFNTSSLSLQPDTYTISSSNDNCDAVNISFKLVGNLNNNNVDRDNISNKILSQVSQDNIKETIFLEKGLIMNIDNKLASKLKGRILLQVENHGEAWYVNPKNSKKYYMANGNEAHRIMRYLGVGITNKDLDKVIADKNTGKKHSGKIFLQIEAHGEAYYIDIDGKAHYLKDGNAAYKIMRDLGLGIKNNDLRKIDIDEI